MAATPEAKVKKAVKKILEENGAYVVSVVTHGYGASGVPDIIACVKGRFLAIECKAGINQPTTLQNKNLHLISRAGGVAMVVNESNIGLLRLWIAAA